MHLSIHTREVDNGFILDAEMPGILSLGRGGDKKGIHEVYRDWGGVRGRVVGLLEEVVEELKEGIPAKGI